jgi:hypothetical protein
MSTFFVTEELIKARAKLLGEILKSDFEMDVAHGKCLKIASQMFGFKNWNTAKALVTEENRRALQQGEEAVAEIMSDPIEGLRFIRDREQANLENVPDYAARVKSGAKFFEKSRNRKRTSIGTVAELREALEPFDGNAPIDAHFVQKLEDITNGVDEFSSPHDELGYEFALSLGEDDHHGGSPGHVTLNLKLDHAYLSPSNI